ncbi:hypothetical protein SETIT_7G103800v2 [Setaria italica]|uniref:Uncharacterized protein n=1 Tax=Setaria italica TaxID=4555 RepID=A0A368RU65_SETIT|nr:hypothetical protein SETIT_7G103800v2 [Setaria italica]
MTSFASARQVGMCHLSSSSGHQRKRNQLGRQG